MSTLELEHHQLEQHYAGLRSTSHVKERRLLASLAQVGQQSPVVVVQAEQANRYVLIDGYKRVRALDKLQKDTVIAVVWELQEPDALIMERMLRRPDSDGPLEQGWLLKELHSRFGMSLDQLAQRFDVSKSWVSRRLGLVQQLPDFVQKAVRDGHIVAHAAMKFLLPLARANGDDARRLCQAVSGLKLSTRQFGMLYTAYRRADEANRELIFTQPEMFLRAEQELHRKDQPDPDPIQQLMHDLDVLCGLTRRIRSRFSPKLLSLFSEDKCLRIKACMKQVYLDVEVISNLIEEEQSHA